MKIVKILISIVFILSFPYLPVLVTYLLTGMSFDYSATVTDDIFHIFQGFVSVAGLLLWSFSFAEHDNGFFFPDAE